MNERLAAQAFVADSLSLDDARRAAAVQRQLRDPQARWETIVEYANNHLLTPALWVALRDAGFSSQLPADLAGYLEELHGLSIERNNQLRQQLLQAVRHLNKAGIRPVLLKGAAHLVCSIYPDPGVRVMSDIDLLVEPEQVTPAYELLMQLGYQPDDSCLHDYPDEHHHCPPLFRPGDYASIEIHRRLMDSYEDLLAAPEALESARCIEYEDASMRLLSPTHRVLHNLVHSQLVDGHYVSGVTPMRSLSEVALESRQAPPDWALIVNRMTAGSCLEVLQAYLYEAHELFAMPWPAGQTASIGARLYSLRCRRQLAWPWFDIWGLRIGRFSSANMRKLYGCGDSLLEHASARLRYAGFLLGRRFLRR